MSLYFEDFVAGHTLVSPSRSITETDVLAFADLSGDIVELHTNEEVAGKSMFGSRIAQGALVLSISIGLTTRMGSINETILALYEIDKLRFTKPVFLGDTVYVRKRVAGKREIGKGRGLITFESRVSNQNEEIVVVYRDSILFKSRSNGIEDGEDRCGASRSQICHDSRSDLS